MASTIYGIAMLVAAIGIPSAMVKYNNLVLAVKKNKKEIAFIYYNNI